LNAARRFITEGFDFDAIDAHYFYPDGVAAAHNEIGPKQAGRGHGARH
jgi:hypothetical protein